MTGFQRRSHRWFPWKWGRPSSERGDTLVEILVAILILSVAGVALLAAFSTNIAGSAAHRKLANSDLVLRGIAEAAYSQIQIGDQSTAPLYSSCATSYSVDTSSTYPGYVPTATVTKYWDPTSSSWLNSPWPQCSGQPMQLVTISVTDSLDKSIGTTSIVVNGLGTGAGQPRAGGMSVTSLSPAWLNQGATNATLTIFGTGFARSDSVTFPSNSGVTVNSTGVTSSTELQVTVSVSPSATVGSDTVTVASGRQFATGTLPIGAVTVNPVTLVAGQYESVTISGTNFLAGATPTFSSVGTSSVTVNSVSPATVINEASSIGVGIHVPLDSTPGTVTVANPDGSLGSADVSIVPQPTLSSCALSSGKQANLRSNSYNGDATAITCTVTVPGAASSTVFANGAGPLTAISPSPSFSVTFPVTSVTSTSTTTGSGDSKVTTTTSTYTGTVIVSYQVPGGSVIWPGSATLTITTTSK